MGKVIYLFKGGNVMTIFHVADAFLRFEPMTNKKLQKLCYYAQAWHLALNNEPLVRDCKFEAWIHGPVCPELYHRYKKYGRSPITEIEDNLQHINDDYTMKFIESIYEVYGNLTGDELELLTHSEDPWKKARGNLKDWQYCHNEILHEDMIDYYSKQ